MKILYIDCGSNGHYRIYRRSLLKNSNINAVFVLPDKDDNLDSSYKQYIIPEWNIESINWKNYLSCMSKFKKIVRDVKPNIIHFLTGDILYPFYGVGIEGIKYQSQIIITFHHMNFQNGWKNKIKLISIFLIFRNISCGIVHSECIFIELKNRGIRNAVCIHYPAFNGIYLNNKEQLMHKYNIPTAGKILLALGGTRYDKGLDILLQALKNIDTDFTLMIAGKEEEITQIQIESLIQSYKDKVIVNLNYMTDIKMQELLNISDIICIPYRKSFNGASGPMCDGIGLGKMIIGSNHGTIGDIIRKHHVGIVFESESSNDLEEKLKMYLTEDFKYDDIANEFQKRLSILNFQKNYQEVYKENECKNRFH